MHASRLHLIARTSGRLAPLLADAGRPRLARRLTAVAATVTAFAAAAMAWRAAIEAADAWQAVEV